MKTLAILLLPVALLAQPNITPSTPPIVQQGTTKAFTADVAVTWSMSAGSAGTINSSTGVYTAPSKVTPNNQAGGCQLAPNTHVFNSRVDSLPKATNVTIAGQTLTTASDTWMSNAGGTTRIGFIADGDMPLNYALSTDSTTSFHHAYSNTVRGYLLPPYPNRQWESGEFNFNQDVKDHHLQIVVKDTCEIQELYQFYPVGFSATYPLANSSSGAKYTGPAFDLAPLPDSGTDAAGMEMLPLLLRLDELQSGAVNHAIRFTLPPGYMDNTCHIWPAQADNASNNCAAITQRMPYGARVRLKAAFDDSALSANSKVITTALKRYGAFNADIGTAWSFQLEQNTYPASWRSAFDQVSVAVHASDFEIVDESGLMVSATNGITTSASAETVIATATVGGLTSSRQVALQGVTIGRRYRSMVFQAGAAATQLEAWVNGSANKAITWSLSPSVGSINSSTGVYTPPATGTVKQTATVTATSSADGTVATTILITILPLGTIRVNAGDTSDYTDGSGNVWLADFKAGDPEFGGNSSLYPYDNATTAFTGTTTPALYQWIAASTADITYRMVVPNGNYRITQMFADTIGSTRRLMWLDSNGQVVRHNYDIAAVAGGALAATSVDLPAKVTDGTLTFSARAFGSLPTAINACCTSPLYHANDGTRGFGPMLAAFTIVPDASAPYIAIDNPDGDGAAITAGSTRQLYSVGWYMAGSVTWSRSPAIGSIDSNGLYTAPSTPPASDTVVTITATSTVDVTKTATTTALFTFGTLGVTPSSGSMNRGATRTFAADINGTAYTNVTWSRSPGVGSINSTTGVYTAPQTLATDTAVTITARSVDDPTKTATATVTVLAVPLPIRIACGDPLTFVDENGNTWSVDSGYSTGTSSNRDGTNTILGASTQMQPLYKGARYVTSGNSFFYLFAVPNGAYRVTLKFADYAYTTPGHYDLNAAINSVQVLTSFDPHAAAGANFTAVDRSYGVVVGANQIRIDFTAVTQAAEINGIEILPITIFPPSTLNGGTLMGGASLK